MTLSISELTPLLDSSFFDLYELDEILGGGAMGVVVKAHQKELDRMVAIKFVLDIPVAKAEMWKRFKREAKVMSKIRHPNVTGLYDYGTSNDHPYLVTELLEGRTLGDYMLRMGDIPADESLAIMLQLAKGLECTHREGVVHRDLKPANIFLCDDDVVKIVDFGLASSEGGETQLTRTGQVLGTPLYMSPEQISGGVSGPATDIFALGTIAYEMVTGAVPTRAPSMLTLIQNKMKGEWELLTKRKPAGIPLELCQIIDECMAMEADDRPSAEELVQRLSNIEDGPQTVAAEPIKELPVIETTPIPPKPKPKLLPILGVALLLCFALFCLCPRQTNLTINEFKCVETGTTSATIVVSSNKLARANLALSNALDGKAITKVGSGAMQKSWYFNLTGLPSGTAHKVNLKLSKGKTVIEKELSIMTELLEPQPFFELPYQDKEEKDKRIGDVPTIVDGHFVFGLSQGYLGSVSLQTNKFVFEHKFSIPGNVRCDKWRAIFYGKDFVMRCFNPVDGTLLWKRKLPQKGFAARFFVDKEKILLRLNDGGYLCLSAIDGKEHWRVEDPLLTRPYHVGGDLLVTNHLTAGRLPFWDLNTGRHIPENGMNAKGLPLTVTRYFDGEFYLGVIPHTLLVGNPRKGVRLKIDTVGMCSRVSVTDGKILLLTKNYILTCFSQRKGKQLWQREIERLSEKPVLQCASRFAFIVHDEKGFTCFDVSSGRQLFQWLGALSIPSEVLYHEGELFFSANGRVFRMPIN